VTRVTGDPPPEPLELDFDAGDDGRIFAAAGIPYVKLGPGSPPGRDPRFGREQVGVALVKAAARAYVVIGATLAAWDRLAVERWPPVGIERDPAAPRP
jgi:hypothetical protein